MMRWTIVRTRGGLGALTALVLAAGIARAEPPGDPDRGLVHWWPTPTIDPATAASRPPATILLDLPRVACAGEDMDLGPQVGLARLIVNLPSDGRVIFQGSAFAFDDPDPAKSRVLRKAAAPYLARAWKKAHVGKERLGLLIRADRRKTWGQMRDLLDWALGSVDSVDGIHFAVDTGALRDGAPWDGRLEASSRALAPAEAPPLALTLDVAETAGSADPNPRIVFGGTPWVFPAGDPYEAGPTLDAANAGWDALLGALRRVPSLPRPVLRVTIDPRVPWAHVAQVLGLARLAGIPDVDLVPEKLGLQISSPVPDLGCRGGAVPSPADSGGGGRSLLSLCLVAGLLGAGALGAGFWFRQRRAASALPEVEPYRDRRRVAQPETLVDEAPEGSAVVEEEGSVTSEPDPDVPEETELPGGGAPVGEVPGGDDWPDGGDA